MRSSLTKNRKEVPSCLTTAFLSYILLHTVYRMDQQKRKQTPSSAVYVLTILYQRQLEPSVKKSKSSTVEFCLVNGHLHTGETATDITPLKTSQKSVSINHLSRWFLTDFPFDESCVNAKRLLTVLLILSPTYLIVHQREEHFIQTSCGS